MAHFVSSPRGSNDGATKSPRGRRNAALQDDVRVNPFKQRKETLQQLGEVLQGIPHVYQQQDFCAIAQVIRMIEVNFFFFFFVLSLICVL